MSLRPGPAFLVALAAATALTLPSSASAHVDAAVTVAGPDPAIIDVGGVAMAPDGTGGVVFRRSEGGIPHVYAARYDGERWHAPQRVDAGQRFTSTWPRIGAADGGRLVVTWVQEGPPSQDSMYSAALPRGSAQFLAPTLVDFTIGDSRAAFPDLAMAPNGDALLVYHRVTRFGDPLLGLNYVGTQIKLSRFNGSRWSGLGVPANRVPTTPVRLPTAAAGPKVAIGADGSAAVAWQEPDETLQDRVWTRRIFGQRLGVVLPASPTTADGKPARGAADGVDVAVSDNGRVVVAVRQQPDPTDRGQPARIYLNQLDEPESGAGTSFGGAQVAQAPPAGITGTPRVAIGGRFGVLLAWSGAGGATVAQGTGATTPNLVGFGGVPEAPGPVTAQGVDGRGTVAHASAEGGGQVVVRELSGAQVTRMQAVSGAAGGPVDGLDIGDAGNGNALVAFSQGAQAVRQIAVARVNAPPVSFLVEAPPEWTNVRRPLITWQAPPNDPRPRHYTVRIDGEVVARKVYSRRLQLEPGALRDGQHTVQVSAASRTGGGETVSPEATFGTDRRPPLVSVTRKGRRVRVRITDPGGKGKASGPAEGGTTIDWGDDDTSDAVNRSASHVYRKAATVSILVRAQDVAGNVTNVRQSVRVPGPAKTSKAPKKKKRAPSPKSSSTR
ncbi:hypothetical protein [Patulibacter americanus]|uniref:hypothetical protein n=1 Tax=Patulibacter americanus TaxID=588672 RepID=UPI0003B6CF77|nr:hypothetical protein [Patulibacter americanus]